MLKSLLIALVVFAVVMIAIPRTVRFFTQPEQDLNTLIESSPTGAGAAQEHEERRPGYFRSAP